MTRVAATILIGLFGIDWFGAGCVLGQSQPRRLLYNPNVAIADRLLPQDKEVFIYKESAGPYAPVPTEQTYEQEIQKLRLRDVTALVKVDAVQAELIKDGTWIRTNVTGTVEDFAQRGRSDSPSNPLEFTFPGGQMRIGDVHVTAGAFPDFNKDERYLVSFVTRPRVTPVLIYRVDDSGELRPMRWNPGGEQKIHTNLFGRRVSDVLEALKGK